MKRAVALVIACLCLLNVAVAQKNITIKCTSENAVGKTVELYQYSDKISCFEVLVDKVVIDENQQFELQCYANYPMLVFLQIDNYTQSFYVEPAREYRIKIPTFDWSRDEKEVGFSNEMALPVEFLNLPANDINILTNRFDAAVARYLEEHRAMFDYRYRPQKRYFDSLEVYVNKQCPDVEGCTFFNRYKVYQLAELKLNMKFDTRRNIFRHYIQGQPVLVNDENYMSLFVALYSNAISKGTKDISVYRLAHWVYNMDLNTFIDSIGVDPLLRHEQVRELAALLALKEAYYNFRYYDSESVVKMVERIAERTKFNEHKPIARNLVEMFHRSEGDGEVPNYVLPTVDKENFDLESLRGKWVYMAFVRVGDPVSKSELETMAHFKEQVYQSNDSVAFVTIDCDREFQKMYHFLKNSKHGDRFDWTWLHFNGNYDLLNQFRVVSYPTFVLINPNGEQQYDITPAPSSGFFLNTPWSRHTPQSDDSNPLFRY